MATLAVVALVVPAVAATAGTAWVYRTARADFHWWTLAAFYAWVALMGLANFTAEVRGWAAC